MILAQVESYFIHLQASNFQGFNFFHLKWPGGKKKTTPIRKLGPLWKKGIGKKIIICNHPKVWSLFKEFCGAVKFKFKILMASKLQTGQTGFTEDLYTKTWMSWLTFQPTQKKSHGISGNFSRFSSRVDVIAPPVAPFLAHTVDASEIRFPTTCWMYKTHRK